MSEVTRCSRSTCLRHPLSSPGSSPESPAEVFYDYIWLPDIAMSTDDDVQGTSISQAHTLEEIAAFWGTHSLDDYWEQTHEAAFEVRAKRRRCVTLDPD